MKIIRYIFLIVSIILALLIPLVILDCHLSITYDASPMAYPHIEYHINNLWLFFGYVIVNIIYLIICIIAAKRIGNSRKTSGKEEQCQDKD